MSAAKQLSTTVDLDSAWESVVRKFKDEVGPESSRMKTLTVGDVLANLKPPADTEAETQRKAKRVASRVLTCVQRIGDSVATATGAVFGPSQQCWNALNFVIIAVQGYKKIFEDLTLLLERVSVFLETLDIYLIDKNTDIRLDARLRPAVYRVLEHFMEILTLIARLKRRKEKWGAFAKMLLFDDDSGVTDALGTLETLVAEVVNIQVTVIGKDLSKAAQDIRDLKEDTRRMLANDVQTTNTLSRIERYHVTKNDEDCIRTWLQLQDTTSVQSRHLRLHEERVKNTGSWLVEEHDDFARWFKGQDGDPVLLVTGGPGRGKTFLASRVVDHLRKHVESEPSSRHIVAYHYAQDESPDTKGPLHMYSALQSIVWQFAQSDMSYYEFIIQKRRQVNAIEGTKHLWDTVVASFDPKEDTTLFLVVDGLKKATVNDFNIAVQVSSYHVQPFSQKLRLRLFATTTEDAAKEIKRSMEMTTISLDNGLALRRLPPNIADVERLIMQRLAPSQFFREESTKAKVMKKLQKHVQNDFIRLDLVLRELEHCNNSRQLRDILARLNESMITKVGRHIKPLNDDLSTDEILEINAILVCMGGLAHASGYISVHVVEEFVNLTRRLRLFSPIRQQIENKYHALFVIDCDDDVKWRHPNLKKYLLTHARDERTLEEIDKRRGKVKVGWDLEEVDLLEKVVTTNFTHVFGDYGKIMFNKYGFADFFASKRGRQRAYISLDKWRSRVRALRFCLEVLCGDPDDPRVQHIHEYSRQNLLELLRSAEPQHATQQQRKLIAKWASELIEKDYLIERWSRDEDWSHSMRCIYDEAEVLRRWIEAGNPNRADGDDHQEDNDDDSSEDDSSDDDSSDENDKDNPDRSATDSRLFKRVADRLIYLWVERGNDAWANAYHFMDKNWVSHDGNDETSLGLPQCEPESIWRSLKSSYSDLDHDSVVRLLVERVGEEAEGSSGSSLDREWAMAICTMYLDRDADTWWALLFVADEFRRTSRVKEAEQLLLSAAASSKIRAEHAESYWQRLVPLRERCQAGLKDLTGLAATYTHIIQECSEPSQQTLTFQKLVQLRPDYTIDILRIADECSVPWKPSRKWSQELIDSITEDYEIAYLLAVAFHGENSGFIVSLLRVTLKASSDQSNDGSDDDSDAGSRWTYKGAQLMSKLQSALATILWNSSCEVTARQWALDMWTELGDFEAIYTVLLQQARMECPNAPLESPSAQRLARLFGSQKVGSTTAFKYQLLVAHWKFRSGQSEEARSDILALLDDRQYAGEGFELTSAQLEDVALACFAVREDEVGREVWSQQHHRYEKPRHFLCESLCPKDEVDSEHDSVCDFSHDWERCTRAQYVCLDCFSVVYAQCHKRLQTGSRLQVICGADDTRSRLYLGGGRDQERTAMRQSPKSRKRVAPGNFFAWAAGATGMGRVPASLYKPDLSVFAKARAVLGGADVVGEEDWEVGKRFVFMRSKTMNCKKELY